MVTVWRLVTARHVDTAFSGEGARLYGGRWNRKGVPLVYTAASQALALLEMLVQDEPPRARYLAIPALIPEGLTIERVAVDDLPADWRDIGARPRLREIGSAWVEGLSSAVLAVPSAVVPAEWNFLLNPRHPAFAAIQVGEPEPLTVDPRLLRG